MTGDRRPITLSARPERVRDVLLVAAALEMAGATVFLYALMRHVAPVTGAFALR
jgi:hypothetical protein